MSLIFHFGDKNNATFNGLYDATLLGNKGAGLARIADLGFCLPPGFIISSKLCQYYYQHNKTLPTDFDSQLQEAVEHLELVTGKAFGQVSCQLKEPLLVSVRSGAAVSMPGMMDTILNIGLNATTLKTLSKQTNDAFAQNSYQRFLQMYGVSAMSLPSYLFQEHNMQESKTLAQIQETIARFEKNIPADQLNQLQDVRLQLKNAIIAVLDSWMLEKAVTYRKIYNISHDIGTAIIVQKMVFGNMNDNSGTGVVFSRNPLNGNREAFGEFLLNAQGEDVVAGTCNPIAIMDQEHPDGLQQRLPQNYQQLLSTLQNLEQHFLDMQDVEFTIENGQLYILQTRNAKRSTLAAIKTAVDMANEGLISKKQAISRVEPEHLSQLMHIFVDYSKPLTIIGKGLAASPGSACGVLAFNSEEAEKISAYHPVILVRQDTSPEDIKGMYLSCGILTSKGGMTSHAAVVARGMGKPCVCGAAIIIDNENKTVKIGDHLITANDYLTIDGGSGNIILGKTELVAQKMPQEFDVFMSWVDELRTLKVRANAENVLDIQAALKFGAEGIGLCRTEHMLFEQERLLLIRKIILADTMEEKEAFIAQLLPLHKQDFKDIFALTSNTAVNIRLFDPPLHEFLPFENFTQIAQTLNISTKELQDKIQAISEENPMLGHRGCRLGITLPALYEMQIKAIFQAAHECGLSEDKSKFKLEIMLPFIATIEELIILKNMVRLQAQDINNIYRQTIDYKLGIMIELPRAALIADKLAELVDYFSFGTNDLTQMTYGLSRDDMSYFAQSYQDNGIFKADPFVVLDTEGVGKLIEMACQKGRTAKANIGLSVCGEHGGDATSIKFFNSMKLGYVSCSPFRIIIAKLAAAQANL